MMAMWIMARAFLVALFAVPIRRLIRGRARPAWTFRFEFMTRVLKRSFTSIWKHSYPRQRRYLDTMARWARTDRSMRYHDDDTPGVSAVWCEPIAGARHAGVYLYFHGGGFHSGSAHNYRALIAHQTLAIGCRTLVLNYRLTPEHVFPSQLDDAIAAYRGLIAKGFAADRIILGGDSAGANLVLATATALPQHGLPRPRALVCICPWVELGARGGSLDHNSHYDWLPAHFETWAKAYAGETPVTHPLVSPGLADLRGLSPLLVQVGTAEMLLDQVRRFVERAREAGVEVTYHEYDDMVHNWHMFGGMCSQSLAAIDEIGRYCRTTFDRDDDEHR
jgi:acetyl esterase/lipase